MKKLILVFLCLAGFILRSEAQSLEINGVVTDAEDGQPIPGVTILVKGTSQGTITDLDGKYTINVPSPHDTLVFSFVGKETRTFPVNDRRQINVTLRSKAIAVEEVVVTAMGIRKEKKALGYTTQQVEGDEIENSGEEDIAKAMQGKVAGVLVQQKSGMPGAGSQVRIRGNSSISTNNQPLYVVDGMPVSTDRAFTTSLGEGTDPSSRSLDIDPSDIKSVNILKGAAAAALYGLRASNGVVVITTKSGDAAANAKQNTLVTINSTYTREQVSRLPKLQDQYAQGDDGRLNLYSSYSWGPRIDTLEPYQSQEENYMTGAQNPYSFPVEGKPTNTPAVYENIGDFFQPGETFKNSVNIATSNTNGQYALGFSSVNQSGIIPATGMDKFTTKFKGMLDLTDKIKAGASLNYSNIKVNKVPDGPNVANPLFSVYFAPRTYDLANTPYEHPDNQYIQKHYRKDADNPYWALEHNNYQEQTSRFFGNMNFVYSPNDWLNASYRAGIDNYTLKDKGVVSLGSGEGRGYPVIASEPDLPSGGKIKDRIFYFNSIYSNLQLNVTRKINEDIGMNVLVGNEFYDTRTATQSLLGTGIQIGGFDNIMGTNEQLVSSIITRERTIGIYGSLEMNYKSTLFLTTTGRTDIVSNMPRGNRTFFYPSVSLGFVFTELDYFRKNKYLAYGKVRVSYAQVGQAGDIYATNNYYFSTTHTTGLSGTSYTFPYKEIVAYSETSTLRTDNLRPQNNKTFETGIDLRFFNNRVGVDYTFYKTNAKDQIFTVPLPRSTGYANEYRNAGEIQNIGHEVMLSLKPVKNNNFSWTIRTNFTTYNNTVKSLSKEVERIAVGDQNFESVGVFAYEGLEYPVIFGSSYVRDQNGNIVVDSRKTTESGSANPNYGMPLQGDPKVIAKVNPDFEFNFFNTMEYKSFTLSIQADWRKGGNMFSGMNALLWAYGIGEETENREQGLKVENVKKGYIDNNGQLVVVGENDITIPADKMDVYYDQVLWNISESAVFNTTFFRLREIRISYEIPGKWLKSLFAQSATVYLSGRNLWLMTDYPNFDPEVSTSSGNGIGGFEYIALPNTKSFGGGVKLKF